MTIEAETKLERKLTPIQMVGRSVDAIRAVVNNPSEIKTLSQKGRISLIAKLKNLYQIQELYVNGCDQIVDVKLVPKSNSQEGK